MNSWLLLGRDGPFKIPCIQRQINFVTQHTITLLQHLFQRFVRCDHILNLIGVVVKIVHKLLLIVALTEDRSSFAFENFHFLLTIRAQIQDLFIVILLYISIHKWWFIRRLGLFIKSLNTTLIQIFSDEKSSFFLLQWFLWLHLRKLRLLFGCCIFWWLYRRSSVIENIGIVLNCKRFSKYKWIWTMVNVLFVYLYQSFALSIVYHILKSLRLIGSSLSPGSSKIGGRVNIFIYKLATPGIPFSKQNFKCWVFKIDRKRISSYD